MVLVLVAVLVGLKVGEYMLNTHSEVVLVLAGELTG